MDLLLPALLKPGMPEIIGGIGPLFLVENKILGDQVLRVVGDIVPLFRRKDKFAFLNLGEDLGVELSVKRRVSAQQNLLNHSG